MIVKSFEGDRFVEKPPAHIVAVLLFGPDQGLVRERAEALTKAIVSNLNDPFRVAELSESAIASDGARLFDEAAALSFSGGRRVVRVRNAGNGLAKLFESFLEDSPGDALVVVESGDLAKSAALRKAFAEAGNAAAIECYPDSAQTMKELVRRMLKSEGLTIGEEALEDAVSRLGSDRAVARGEIAKLALYARGKTRIEIEDIRAAMGDETEARAEEVCDAAGEGNVERLDLALERAWTADISVTELLRKGLSHFQRLLQVKLARERGESVDFAMKRGGPQIHFSRAASFKAQVQRWSEERLLSVCDLLLETELQTRTTGMPAEAVTSRAFFTIAALARRPS